MNGIVGLVEVVKNDTVSGWVYEKDSSEPVVVSLYIDDVLIRSRRADNQRDDIARGGNSASSGFNFHINPNLLEVLPTNGVVSVVVSTTKQPLPLMAGESNIITGSFMGGTEKLKSMLAEKWHIDHWGTLQVSFGKDPSKLTEMLDFYCEMKDFFKSSEDIDIYLTGGNLLGLIRESKFLDHDDDVDAAFTIRAETPQEAADKFFDVFSSIAPKLYALGYEILLVDVGQFHVFERGRPGLDVFLGWTTSDKHWYRFIGAGGYLGDDEMKTREIEYLGRKVLIPQHAETELDLTYGKNWRKPDPHFFWQLEPHVKAIMNDFVASGKDRLREWQALLSNAEAKPEWINTINQSHERRPERRAGSQDDTPKTADRPTTSDFIQSIAKAAESGKRRHEVLSAISNACRALTEQDLPPIEFINNIGSNDYAHFKGVMLRAFGEFYDRYDLSAKSRIFDLGSGCGRLAFPFSDLVTEGSYVGADVWSEGVNWCRERFSNAINVSFFPISVQNNYYVDAVDFSVDNKLSLPFLQSESIDFAFAISVFSHLRSLDAEAYLSEFSRILAPSGVAHITCHIIDDFFHANRPIHNLHPNLKEIEPGCWHAYRGQDFFAGFSPEKWTSMVEDAGLRVVTHEPGRWANKPGARAYQDAFTLVRKDWRPELTQ